MLHHPLPAYLFLAVGSSWAAVLWVVAPTGIPGSGVAYVQRGPLAFLAGPSAIVREWFGDDASTTHTGSAPQAHAGFRNLP